MNEDYCIKMLDSIATALGYSQCYISRSHKAILSNGFNGRVDASFIYVKDMHAKPGVSNCKMLEASSLKELVAQIYDAFASKKDIFAMHYTGHLHMPMDLAYTYACVPCTSDEAAKFAIDFEINCI